MMKTSRNGSNKKINESRDLVVLVLDSSVEDNDAQDLHTSRFVVHRSILMIKSTNKLDDLNSFRRFCSKKPTVVNVLDQI